jgi:hypothetical protein
MESDWVKIYTASSYVQAEIIRNRLLEEDIPSAQINKQDSMHIHLNANSPIDVYVAKDNAFRAVQIIKKSGGKSHD